MRTITLILLLLVTGCEGFVSRIPCESGRAVADASAFLFCKEIDDETTIGGAERAEEDVPENVGEDS